MAEPTSTNSFAVEQWKPAPGWEGWYSVSSHGRVRRDKAGMRAQVGRILKPHPTRKGYTRAKMCRKPAWQGLVSIHKLVAAAFIGPCPSGFEVNHKDLNKANNRADNLEYVTSVGNMQHVTRNDRHGRSKLRVADVHAIRRLLKSGALTQAKIAAQFGVGPDEISRIKTGDRWGFIPVAD